MAKAPYYTIRWEGNSVSLLDQRYLPSKEIYRRYRKYSDVIKAIKTMEVRGAPAIGVAAAMGIALAINGLKKKPENFRARFQKILKQFADSRPTAVNLFWAIDRMSEAFSKNYAQPLEKIKENMVAQAKKIYSKDIEANSRLSAYGQRLIGKHACILTHCNAGPLATAGVGTALGVIIAAKRKGKKINLFIE